MTKDDWMFRYKQVFVSRGLSPLEAAEVAAAETFETLSHGYEDDPEGAALEELSNWDME